MLRSVELAVARVRGGGKGGAAEKKKKNQTGKKKQEFTAAEGKGDFCFSQKEGKEERKKLKERGFDKCLNKKWLRRNEVKV